MKKEFRSQGASSLSPSLTPQCSQWTGCSMLPSLLFPQRSLRVQGVPIVAHSLKVGESRWREFAIVGHFALEVRKQGI